MFILKRLAEIQMCFLPTLIKQCDNKDTSNSTQAMIENIFN